MVTSVLGHTDRKRPHEEKAKTGVTLPEPQG